MRTPRQVLADARTIAVVGASRDPLKPAHWVPRMLQQQGWRIVPVNPHAGRLFGEHTYARLADVPVHVDVVEVFRPAGEAPDLVRQAAAIGAGAVWLQRGIVSPQARRLARDAGLDYVEDACMGMERTLAQMVAGGTTPRPVVYRGIEPQPEQPWLLVRHHRLRRPPMADRPVKLVTAAPWFVRARRHGDHPDPGRRPPNGRMAAGKSGS